MSDNRLNNIYAHAHQPTNHTHINIHTQTKMKLNDKKRIAQNYWLSLRNTYYSLDE